MTSFEVEQVEGVEPPRRAKVEEAEVPAETLAETLADKILRKRDYLEGFLAEKPEGLASGEPGGDLYEAVVAALKEIGVWPLERWS